MRINEVHIFLGIKCKIQWSGITFRCGNILCNGDDTNDEPSKKTLYRTLFKSWQSTSSDMSALFTNSFSS